MEKNPLEQKWIIVNKLVNSGINITPRILDFILKLDNPQKNLNLIIKELSFIPTFKSHLTNNVLKKISNEAIQKILKKTTIKSELSPIDKNSIEQDKKLEEKDNLKIFQKVQDTKPIIAEVDETYDNFNTNLLPPSNANYFGQIPARKKLKIKPSESTKSTIHFRPSAKEYNFDFKILKDPSGKLYTNGRYEDFFDLTSDKFNKLQTLMKKRPEVLSAKKINNILRLSRDVEISTLGLVKNIYQTKKNNYLIELEDQTGIINVLVRKDTENQEFVKIIQRTVFDQMLYVEGIYNLGNKSNKGIIFANYVSKIDIPVDYQPNKSLDPLSIALISDTHIGSKEFEEPLFKKFINFLKGKIGNKTLRDIAGRVKYIVVNGDLVDGIGVYPNQENDLIISDIYKQFEKASEMLVEIPEYIKIFYVSGNHEPVRNAIPRPKVPKKYCENLVSLEISCLGNPSLISTHNVNTLIYHGESIHDMNMLIHDLDINKPIVTMKEFLICRHLAPIYGEKTQIAPTEKDWLIIDKIPDIFHTGHIHINGSGKYNNVTLINSGCFQAQTDFMRSFGIEPTPGIVPIIELDTLKAFELYLNENA